MDRNHDYPFNGYMLAREGGRFSSHKAAELHTTVYFDESRITQYPFVVTGALVVDTAQEPAIREQLCELRVDLNMLAEFKWTKVSNTKLPHYQAISEWALALLEQRQLSLVLQVISRREPLFRQLRSEFKQLGHAARLYELMPHIAAIDQSTTRHAVFDGMLPEQQWLAAKQRLEQAENLAGWTMEGRRSKADDLLQVIDLIIGGFGSWWNNQYQTVGSNPAKKTLANQLGGRITKLNSESQGTIILVSKSVKNNAPSFPS